jgi:hypothetical protein
MGMILFQQERFFFFCVCAFYCSLRFGLLFLISVELQLPSWGAARSSEGSVVCITGF